MIVDFHGSLNVPIEHHPTIRYMVYNGYYKVMSNIPKMEQLPTPDFQRCFAVVWWWFETLMSQHFIEHSNGYNDVVWHYIFEQILLVADAV